MKTFIIEFWYNTDLRCDREIKAMSALHALSLISEKELNEWCEFGPQFIVKIKQSS